MSGEKETKIKALRRIKEFHREADQFSSELANRLGGRIRCRLGCCECCADDLTVYTIEALRIKEEFAELLAGALPGPAGACAFLDESGACRIYGARPYVCRTQGLPIRWFDETEDEEIVEHRDICPVNEDGPPLKDLDESLLLTVGPFELRLQSLQSEFDDDKMQRVRLRDLFFAVK